MVGPHTEVGLQMLPGSQTRRDALLMLCNIDNDRFQVQSLASATKAYQ